MSKMIAKGNKIISLTWLRPSYVLLLMEIWAHLTIICGVIFYYGTRDSPPIPFISDLGITYPGTFVFGIALNITAFFGFICVYFRHGCLTKEDLLDTKTQFNVNDVAMVAGFAMYLGMMIVACAPWKEMLVIHMIGAFTFFGSFNVYGGLQCYLSYVTYKKMRTEFRFSRISRLIVLFISIVAVLICVLFFVVPPHGNLFHFHSRTISVIAEWVMGASFLLYFSTFYSEFKHMEFKGDFKVDLRHQIL